MLLYTDPVVYCTYTTNKANKTCESRPDLDAYETQSEYILQVDLPGIKKETVDISLNNNTLTISAERKRPEVENAKWLITERKSGVFKRELQLPEDANPEDLSAQMEDGQLTIVIKKKVETFRKVEIK
jgi:HSP20 family molecular chaperone IbpA